jgi:hypothetical protein
VRLPGARDGAYLCFLGIGAVVVVLLGVRGRAAAGLLPRALVAALYVVLLLPLTAVGMLAGLAGTGLAVWVRRDPRLYMLAVVTATLFVFWVRQPALGVGPAWALLHPAGVLLFSLHWLVEKRGARTAAQDGPRDGPEDLP